MKIGLRLFLLCLALGPRGDAKAPAGEVVDLAAFDKAQQDGSGLVWASSPDGALAIFENDGWRPVSLPLEVSGMKLLQMERDQKGRLLMLWQKARGTAILTESDGSTIQIRARFTEPLRDPTIFCAANGAVWIASAEKIFRLEPGKSEPALAYTIPKDAYDRPLSDQDAPSALHAFEDGQSCIWFWSQAERDSAAALVGVLLFDQKEWRLQKLTNLPASRFSFLERKDDPQVWVGVKSKGLFLLNLVTLEAQPVEEPTPDAWTNVRGMKRSGDENFLVTLTSSGASPGTELWREDKGEWTKIAPNLDREWRADPESERGFLKTASGIFLGGFRTGLWRWRDGKVAQFDWRAGFRLRTINRLFALGGGRVLALQLSRQGSDFVVFDPAKLSPAEPPERVATVPVFQAPAQDKAGRLWVVRADRADALSEWDGKTWRSHVPPPPLGAMRDMVEVDSSKRLWINGRNGHAVGIFDPASERWEVHQNLRAALRAQIHTGRTFADFRASLCLSEDGRAAFLGKGSAVEYFDGKIWRTWTPEEIGPGWVRPRKVSFAPEGSLLVEKDNDRWQFAEGTDWEKATLESSGNQARANSEVNGRETQPCPDDPQTAWVYWDRTDVGWFLRDRLLYRTALGKCVPVFAKGSAQPFLDGRKMTHVSVLVDAVGNEVLQTSDPTELVIIKPPGAFPETAARLVKISEDTATLEFAGHPQPIAWRWRRDGGAWSAPTADPVLRLVFVESGKREVEVVAIDSDLQFDPTPARVEFEMRIDWPGLVASSVALLMQGDERQRNAAIARLAKQPDLADPALHRARIGASADQLWWIDAAIQEIERHQRRQMKE